MRSSRPGQPGWLDAVDRAIAELKPDSLKGYTIGDNTNKDLGKYPWRLDDEKLVYPVLREILKAGLMNVCIHKGLFPPSVVRSSSRTCWRIPMCGTWARQQGTGRSSTSSSTIRPIASAGSVPKKRGPNSRRPGASSGSPILPRFRRKYGVKNVYGDLGQLFAQSTIANPRLCAAMMGILIRGPRRRPCVLGNRCDLDRLAAMADRGAAPARDSRGHAEAIRLRARWERPMAGQDRHSRRQQRAPYKYPVQQKAELATDRFAQFRASYEQDGPDRSNRTYGYIRQRLA